MSQAINKEKSINILNKLSIQNRNKVRAIAFSDGKNAIKVINKLRKTSSANELVQIENTLRLFPHSNEAISEHFPSKPQTKEGFKRLCKLESQKQLELLNLIVSQVIEKLNAFFEELSQLNNCIIKSEIINADARFSNLIKGFGYSHFLLRKAILLKSVSGDFPTPNTDKIIEASGLNFKNQMVTSIMHCYQEEQDFLSIKRAILAIRNEGDWNRYTRDMLRIAFHPHAKNKSDFDEMLQSNLQSSLIDAVIFLKVNKRFIDIHKYKKINEILSVCSLASPDIDCIVNLYCDKEYPEDVFYKQSSAWLENDDLVKYRLLQDHFYNPPEAEYVSLDDDLTNHIKSWVAIDKLDDLADSTNLTSHSFSKLKKIEVTGSVTRSSIFNFIIHTTEGASPVSETNLIKIMGLTSGLSRTINIEYLKFLAINSSSNIAQIILYLLIAKKSKNELDDHRLRRSLQQEVVKNHNSELVRFVSDIAIKSPSVARYAYEVFTEDFIAKLSHLIASSSEITETRAYLHEWMGEFSGESSFIDKAKHLRIDQKINKVKDQLDDHRIYVDSARFIEWMENEVEQELSSVLLILAHNQELDSNEPQLAEIISRCYEAFCSNQHFGIASYLGRRIRHGTFKGHLYSDVINCIEDVFGNDLTTQPVSNIWEEWKASYEAQIKAIVSEKLHIRAKTKPTAIIIPTVDSRAKIEIASSCIQNILTDFKKNKQTSNSLLIIVDYCWRMIEIDLKAFNTYLKGQKAPLMNITLISNIKPNIPRKQGISIGGGDFSRALQFLINDKLSIMYGWFKRPQNVAPRASLGLLFKAVVAEVKQSFKDFKPEDDFLETDDIDLMGGAYHVIYDALFVIVFNSAEHGKKGGVVNRDFKLTSSEGERYLEITVTSEAEQADELVNSKLQVPKTADIENAQLNETGSGIQKLHNLEKYDENFHIKSINCENGVVTVKIAYRLVHNS